MTIGLTLKDVTNELAVEGKVNAKLGIVLAEGFVVQDRAVLYHRMGVVGRDVLHADR